MKISEVAVLLIIMCRFQRVIMYELGYSSQIDHRY